MTRGEARKFVRLWDDHGHQLDIIRKFAEGAVLQYLNKDDGSWEDLSMPDNATLRGDVYRVKPRAIPIKGYVCIKNHLGYEVGNIIGDGMVPLVPTNWKEFTTTVEI